ncbi:MAG: FkbM family methyltransferase, partial [Holosporaceae bacterium]|nr:FkbM family methyltransferase [Holosporaceae bacterium]
QVKCDVEEEAPAYNEIVPMIGWERYSGDSAVSLKGWVRWWKYLRLKKPVLMKWTDGLVLHIYPGNEICRALFVRGIYNPNLVAVINKLLPRDGVYIDVGANMGYGALLAGRTVGKNGRVLAPEPSSRDFERLRDNVVLNNMEGVILPRRLAISDKNGTAKLIISAEERNALNTLGSEISSKGVEKISVEEVETSTLDAFAEKEKVARVDVIKLDIEGSEVNALVGAQNIIEKYRPAIILGVNRNALESCHTNNDELQKTIRKMEYRAYKITEEPSFVLEEITDLTGINAGVIVCLHKDSVLPILPQPKNCSVADKISDFFSR